MKKHLMIFLYSLCLMGVNEAESFTLQTQTMEVNGSFIVLKVPHGMRLEFIDTMDSPRFISIGPDNEFIIGSKGSTLYRVKYPYLRADALVTLNGYLHSTAYRQGEIFAAETSAVWKAPYQSSLTQLSASDFTKVVTLPSETGGHASRTIVNGPDNKLYIGIGISGNCSDEYLDVSYPFEQRRGGVFHLNSNNTLVPFSAGLRNPIGLAFHPQTNTLYATNAGPDNLGYDRPPEVFTALSQGSFHGMPWYQYYDGAVKSGDCAESQPPRPAMDVVLPSALFAPRSTPEGIAFLKEDGLANEFAGSAVVAIHGSWATKPGQGAESRRPPKLSLVVFKNNKPERVEDMITGFQRSDGSRFARPCGVAIGADGNIYFTSDAGEVTGLFRLVPHQEKQSTIISILGVLLGK